MPPKKAVKQPARQLTRTAPPARRRATGPAETVGLTEEQLGDAPAADVLPEAPRPRAMPPAPPPTRAAPPARGVPPARRTVPATSVAGSNLRAMRGRVAQQIQGMDLRDEMAWIRSDIGRLTVLAAGGFVILVVLAVVLPMFNL